MFILGPSICVSVVGWICSPLFLLGGYGFYLLYLMGSHQTYYLSVHTMGMNSKSMKDMLSKYVIHTSVFTVWMQWQFRGGHAYSPTVPI